MNLKAMDLFSRKKIHRHKMGCAISGDSCTLVGGPLTTQNSLGAWMVCYPPRNSNGENILTFKIYFLEKKNVTQNHKIQDSHRSYNISHSFYR